MWAFWCWKAAPAAAAAAAAAAGSLFLSLCIFVGFQGGKKGPGAKKAGGLKIGKKDEGKTKRFFWDPLFADEVQGTLFQVLNPKP